MLKNMKIGRRISLLISFVLVIGLAIIIVGAIWNVRDSTQKDTRGRFGELVDARATVINQYFENHTNFLGYFAAQEVVRDTLKNPTKENIASLKVQMQGYRNARSSMEGMYLSDKDVNCLIHTDVDSAENQLATKTPLEDIMNGSKASKNGVWMKGIGTAASTGKLVAPAYAPVYDTDGTTFIGIVGGGCYINELQELVYGMSLNGYESSQIYLVNAKAGNYIFSPDESQVGQEYDEATKSIVDQAVEKESGVIEYTTDQKYMMAYRYLPEFGFVVYMVDNENEIYSGVNSLSITILSLAIVVLIFIVFVTILVSNNITKDLLKITEVIQGIGTLDITKANGLSEFRDRKDEVGQIADATGKLSYAVSDAVVSIQEKADQLTRPADQLVQNAGDTSQALEHVDTAVQEIATGATSQSHETQEATENVIHMGNMIQDTSQEGDKLKKSSQHMQNSSSKVRDILQKLSDANKKTYDAVEIIAEKTTETNKSAEEIKNAAELISSIASQTNLLSLNASIEAARAGEAGKGFAVVAEEIGKLADQSSESAQQIDEIIRDLVENSTNAVTTMEEVKVTIEEQSKFMDDTREIFNEVEDQIDNSLQGVDSIADKVRVMDEARIAVVDTVQNLTAIAEQNAASTEETSASTSLVGNMMEDVARVADEIAHMSSDIKDSVGVFKI